MGDVDDGHDGTLRDPDRERAWIVTAIDAWSNVPALIRDRHLTVVAANPLARALSRCFLPGVNLARFAFLVAIEFERDGSHEHLRSEVAAMLRDSLDQHEEDAPFRELVGELSARSPAFARAWATEVRPRRSGSATFEDTPVGSIALAFREVWIDRTHDDVLMLWRGEDASSAERLRELARSVEERENLGAAGGSDLGNGGAGSSDQFIERPRTG